MPLDIRRIRALCFDVDGTLSDTDDQMVKQVGKWLRPFSFLFKDRDYLRAARRFVMWAEAPGNALLGLLDKLGMDDEFFRLWEWINRNRPLPMKNFMLIPGAKEMLADLYARYPMAVVSARDEKSTLAFLDKFELRPYFKVVVTALTVPHTKPYPDPIYFAAGAMGVRPESCLMVGDTTVDILAGKASGCQTVGVLCGFGEEHELRKRGADMILMGTHELSQVLN
jgi:phosphoglycolate phosphatase-like HAD superfamily hydrolase